MTDWIGQPLGNYHLRRLLGQGSFADVYLGEHRYLDMHAAIKVLRVRMGADTHELFRQEAQTIARLQHPHIVRLHDFGFQEQTPYLIMEYVPNGTLRGLYPKGTPLALEQIVTYVTQIASALEYAHVRRVIHRDLKPENLLLGTGGEVVLSDFGLAVVQHSLDTHSSHAAAGTPLYMAPEQIQRHPCAASDQYALGVMVYEWLCGEPPFPGPGMAVFGQHLYQVPPSLSQRIPWLSPAVEDVVMQALAKEPALRFPDVQAFAIALEAACLGTQPLQWPAVTLQETDDQETRHLPHVAPALEPSCNESKKQTIPQNMPGMPPLLSSHVRLIAASLDSSESPYYQENALGNQLIRRLEPDGQEMPYAFPTFDFKFQNVGNATAVLWQFVIEVLDAHLDETPLLDFEACIQEKALQITASNHGWGEAYDGEFEVNEPTLNRLFPHATRCYIGPLQSGASQVIFRFTPEEMNISAFEAMSKEHAAISGGQAIAFTPQHLAISWRCRDGEGMAYEGRKQVPLTFSILGEKYLLNMAFLTRNGFSLPSFWTATEPMSSMESTITYIALLDATRSASQHRTYAMARQIPPGDVERFHIMVGSPQSCRLLLRFKFFVDETTMIESETFALHIWNPRNRQLHACYKDATEISRAIHKDIQEKIALGSWTGWELDIVSDHIADYPFLSNGKNFQLLSKDSSLSAEEYQALLVAFEQVLQLDPDFAPAYVDKGKILQRLGRHQEAQEAYTKARLLFWRQKFGLP